MYGWFKGSGQGGKWNVSRLDREKQEEKRPHICSTHS